VSEVNWEEEREQLLEQLTEAQRIALESQAQAAYYLELLEDCNEAARQARDNEDVKLLNNLRGNLMSYYTPRMEEGADWGRDFLHAYKRDASWLEDTKKNLGQIKADAEKFLADNKNRPELADVLKRIIAAADDGLKSHLD
jgi:hypothetical protein